MKYLSLIFTLFYTQNLLFAQENGNWQLGLKYGVQNTNAKYVNQKVLPEIGMKSIFLDYSTNFNTTLGIFYSNYSPYFSNADYFCRVRGENFGIKFAYWIPFNFLYNFVAIQLGVNDTEFNLDYGVKGSDSLKGHENSQSIAYGISTKNKPINFMAEIGYNTLQTGTLKLRSTGANLDSINLSGYFWKAGVIFRFGGIKESLNSSSIVKPDEAILPKSVNE